MKTTTKFLLMGIMMVAIYACKKKEEPTPAPSKTSLLINKKWYMTAATVSPAFKIKIFPGAPELVITNLFDPSIASFTTCIKDDTLEFSAINNTVKSGNYTSEVVVACNGEKDQAGTWAFNSDETKFTTTPSSSSIPPQEFTLLEITNTSMKVNTNYSNPIDPTDKQVYSITATFSKK
jgi:hypothetical protein